MFHLPPLLPGDRTGRTLLVAREVMEIVGFRSLPDDASGDRRHARLRALFDHFSRGAPVTVADDPFRKRRTAILARVHPPADEVWDFRCLDPRPGIRAFGRFAEPDVFVALTWAYREDIAPGDGWTAQIARCRAAWTGLFGALPPFRGDRIDAYLSSGWYPA